MICPICGSELGKSNPQQRNGRLIEILHCGNCGYTIIITHAVDPPKIIYEYIPFTIPMFNPDFFGFTIREKGNNNNISHFRNKGDRK